MGNEPGLAYQNGAMPQAESQRPYYQSVGNEETVFKAAYRQGLSLVLKGPPVAARPASSRRWLTISAGR
jgi:nitric oxide reductase NorQ protein